MRETSPYSDYISFSACVYSAASLFPAKHTNGFNQANC